MALFHSPGFALRSICAAIVLLPALAYVQTAAAAFDASALQSDDADEEVTAGDAAGGGSAGTLGAVTVVGRAAPVPVEHESSQ